MHRGRRSFAAPRSVRFVLGILGVAVLASPALAQQPATQPSTPPKDVYAEVWTPRSETGRIHLHGGVFRLIDGQQTAATIGARLGVNVGSHVLMGILADWSFATKSNEQATDSLPGPQPKIVLQRVDAHLIPAMAFVQVKLTNKFFLVPYFGAGAGYEWLQLNAHDYVTAQTEKRTYANFAWQTYAGLGLALSKDTRLDGELFYNGGELGRDVVDTFGTTWREVVNVDGVGARVGLSLLY